MILPGAVSQSGGPPVLDGVAHILPPLIAGSVTLVLLARRSPLWAIARTSVNFEGKPVRAMGLAVVLGMASGAGLTRNALPWVIAALGFGFFGWLDDTFGDRSATGFKGHLRAASKGRLTTGFWKIIGGGATALLAAYAATGGGVPVRWFLLGVGVALSANAFNLVDTRPARACALFLALMVPVIASVPLMSLTLILPVVIFLYWDRRCLAMLGDAGSNALGAVWAILVLSQRTTVGIVVIVALLVVFHVWTEFNSINAFVSRHAILDRLDHWLRGPAGCVEEQADEPCV